MYIEVMEKQRERESGRGTERETDGRRACEREERKTER